MKITLKLFASLTDYLPEHGRTSNRVECDVAEDASVAQIIETCHLPPKMVHLVLVNGTYIEPAHRASRALNEGDVLAIWPPVAGG
jgi:molybdopterin converting factor small subunit